MNYQTETELLARAFYDAEHDDGLWDFEIETIKEIFRGYALTAVALLNAEYDQSQQQIQSLDGQMTEIKALEVA